MTTSAGHEYRLARQRDSLNIVGSFYNSVVAAMIDGQVTPQGKLEYADAYNLDLGIRIETKARNSNNAFGIKAAQLSSYVEDTPFPLSDTLYCLVSYNHKGYSGKNDFRPNLFRKCRSRQSKYNFLGCKMGTTYLLDLPFIEALEKSSGTERGLFIGEEPVIKIGRKKHLQPLRGAGYSEELRKLRLDPKMWIQTRNRLALDVVHIDTQIEVAFANRVEFNLVTILRQDIHKLLMPVILAKALALE